MTETKTTQKLITRAQAAERYAFSLGAIDNLIREGIIPAIRFSKKCTRIPVERADAAIESLATGGLRK